jgi:hypothetical protein
VRPSVPPLSRISSTLSPYFFHRPFSTAIKEGLEATPTMLKSTRNFSAAEAT